MKRIFWILLAIGLSTLFYSVIRYGLRPKPVPILNATEFERPDQVGTVVYKRLRQNVRAERLVVLGTEVGNSFVSSVWAGFVKAAQADGLKIPKGYYLEQTKPVDWPADIPLEPIPSVEAIYEKLAAGELVLIQAPAIEVSHLNENSLSRKLEERLKHPVLSLSALELELGEEQYDAYQSECLAAESHSSARFSCAAARASRILRRKVKDKAIITAIVERHGLQEYLVFLHQSKSQ